MNRHSGSMILASAATLALALIFWVLSYVWYFGVQIPISKDRSLAMVSGEGRAFFGFGSGGGTLILQRPDDQMRHLVQGRPLLAYRPDDVDAIVFPHALIAGLLAGELVVLCILRWWGAREREESGG